jgi:DnaJ-like protein
MRDPYQVLGLSPGAPGEEVKRAFRELAKQLHPDLRPGDAAAEERFREVVSAYQALTGAPSYAGLDAPETGRAPVRRGAWAKVATAGTVFLLTVVCTVAGVTLWQEPDQAPPGLGDTQPQVVQGDMPTTPAEQSRAMAKGPGVPETVRSESSSDTGQAPGDRPSDNESVAPALPQRGSGDAVDAKAPDLAGDRAPVETAAADKDAVPPPRRERLASPASSEAVADRRVAVAPPGPDASPAPATSAKTLAWTGIRNARFGFSLDYPSDVFVADPAQTDEGAAFRSRDGRARLVVSAGVNSKGTTLAAHRRSLMEGPYGGALLDYTPRRRYWYVLSGTLGEEMLYERVTFSCDGRTVHSWKLAYPLSERAVYDRIVEEMHRRYKHSNGAGARCGETGQQTSRSDERQSPNP